MAAVLALLSASPDMLKYSWTYDGTGGAGSSSAFRSQAQLITDLVGVPGPSPLKSLFENTNDNTAWGALQNGAKLSAYFNNLGMTVAPEIRIQAFVPNGRGMQVNGVDGTAGSSIIEVRFNHTIER
jgi:hypothetical protein